MVIKSSANLKFLLFMISLSGCPFRFKSTESAKKKKKSYSKFLKFLVKVKVKRQDNDENTTGIFAIKQIMRNSLKERNIQG